jgi:hypothetical protein
LSSIAAFAVHHQKFLAVQFQYPREGEATVSGRGERVRRG